MRPLLRRPLLALCVLGFAVLVPALTRLSLPRLAAVLEPRRTRRLDPARAAWLLAQVDRLLARAHPLVRRGCLTRGLTHFYFLRRAGLDVSLQFGMDRSGLPEGHCWLVLDGAPFMEKVDPEPRFVGTFAVPAG